MLDCRLNTKHWPSEVGNQIFQKFSILAVEKGSQHIEFSLCKFLSSLWTIPIYHTTVPMHGSSP